MTRAVFDARISHMGGPRQSAKKEIEAEGRQPVLGSGGGPWNATNVSRVLLPPERAARGCGVRGRQDRGA
eukprot:12932037-Prorocentrum_lima.AAC.1